jgi:hypothetical protein
VIADSAGRAVAFTLAPGQVHELPHALPLLARLPGLPVWIVANRGYNSHIFREHVRGFGARPAIPTTRRAYGRLPGANLQQPQSRRAPLGPSEGVAGRGNTLREDRRLLP